MPGLGNGDSSFPSFGLDHLGFLLSDFACSFSAFHLTISSLYANLLSLFLSSCAAPASFHTFTRSAISSHSTHCASFARAHAHRFTGHHNKKAYREYPIQHGSW
ncbi:hypothetical protein PAXRUDRAFT_831687 [Paxillus rubicundulus Ve08.2h10]|uniref:Uncharacterized protein n=1 Tax=Paxillus rubicundulus Ve08.2h10 TaxID=930991 RepID=A0A0D0DHV9_9AGAM|nr:hypothetical protein PAXRUDRAFT_831687 [Paxillus rubicundulus Ve08.2h10]